MSSLANSVGSEYENTQCRHIHPVAHWPQVVWPSSHCGLHRLLLCYHGSSSSLSLNTNETWVSY